MACAPAPGAGPSLTDARGTFYAETAFVFPTLDAGDHTHFRKVGTRLAQAISKVVLGARVRLVDGVVTEARIAYGSVGPVPLRCPATEGALVGLKSKEFLAAAAHVSTDIKPIDDVRSTADYRLRVAARVLRSWLVTL